MKTFINIFEYIMDSNNFAFCLQERLAAKYASIRIFLIVKLAGPTNLIIKLSLV